MSRRELDFERLEKLIREANERAELYRRRTEDARRGQQEAKERAELYRRRAEGERRKARPTTFEEFTRACHIFLSKPLSIQTDKSLSIQGSITSPKNKPYAMSSRRESDFERIEQLLREANERVEQERKKTRPTTFEEYILTCHTFLSKPLSIQTDKSLSTQGSITSPKDKPCPTLLKPWTDFPILQQQLFERIYEYIPRDAELFSSTQYLTELGQNICGRPLASEKDLEIYQRLAVEQPTTDIISQLQQIKEARDAFNLGEGIIFENHANTLSDSNEEVQQNLQNLRISNQGHSSNSNPKPRNADQICVYREANGARSLCMVIEYKPPHKLSVFNLRAGLLRADKGSMNIPEDIINRITIPTDPENKFVYHSEWLTTAALTQTYAYMIENGLEYSKLATGVADVFLQLKENEPHTLYYHLAEPTIEAEAQSEVDILLCRTTISQNLTFCLMALDSKPRNQKWRNHALETAHRAVIDHEVILRQIPVEDKGLTPPPSVFYARIHPFKRSPIMLRPRNSQKVRNSCGPTNITVHEDPQSPSSSSDETPDVETPSKPKARTHQSSTKQMRSIKPSQTSDVRHRQYCTQACLLGLVRKRPLDDACPNVELHRTHKVGNKHALGRKSFAKLMLRQLAEDPENGCEPLGKQGARGALFKLTLECYGYTFVAKGTVTAFETKLKHEGLVYKHLDKVQGQLIPVYLGNISLVYPYFLDFGVRIVHMLLMSWAGEQARKDSLLTMGRDLAAETCRAVKKLLDCGVEHCDVRPPNVLWNPENANVMLIDFERSRVSKEEQALQETSPNRKRKSLSEPSSKPSPTTTLSNAVIVA